MAIKSSIIIPVFLYIFFMGVVFPKTSFPENKPLIIVCNSRDIVHYSTALKGFEDLLKERGINCEISQYNLQEKKKGTASTISEIKSQKPELVLTFGSSATRSIKAAIKTPVVFSMVLDPVSSGFVKSLKSSGNNLTGVSMDISVHEQFKKIKAVIPRVKTIGVIYDPGESDGIVKEAKRVSKEMGLKLIAGPVQSEKEVPRVLEDLEDKIDVLWAIPDATVFTPQSTRFILLFTLRKKLPFMGLSPPFVKAGALFALYGDYYEMGRQAGEAAVELLKGKSPSDLPIVFPQKSCLVINSRVAEIIGAIIPNQILEQADKIF